MKAIIVPNEIAVVYSHRPDIAREFLMIQVPNGWDDVAKICRKVLSYGGRKFTFTGWNSDRNECYFARSLHETFSPVATVVAENFNN
jgi:hypothetical protein